MSDSLSAPFEDGIPIPPKKRGILNPRIEEMREGQSILFRNEGEAKAFFQAMRYYFIKTTKQQFKPVLRKVDGGWRVWKKAR